MNLQDKEIDVMSSLGKRSTSVDLLKGYAIILVVLGHALQYNINNFDNNIVFRIIYSFHMPLFMFASGYVAFLSVVNKNTMLIIKSKFLQLVIPFLSWYFLINYILIGYYHNIPLNEYIKNIISTPSSGYWFLWVLFLNFIVLTIIFQLKKFIKEEYAAFVITVIIFIIPIHILGFNLLKWYLPFFLAGYLV